MSTAWGPVPLLNDYSSSFSAGSLNPSISALTNRTDLLKERLDGFDGTASVGLLYRDIGLSASDIHKGTLVSYDPAGGTYIPASAEWDYTNSEGEKLVPKTNSYVAGVLLTDVDPVDGSALIMCNGIISNTTLVNYLSPNGVGDYYLTVNGNASKTVPADSPRVYCYTRTASGKIVFKPQTPEYGGHTHDTYILNGSWTSVPAGSVPAAILNRYTSTSKCFKYNITRAATPGLYSILNSSNTSITISKNGEILDRGYWCFESNSIFIAENITSTDRVELFAISPITGVRSAVVDIVSETGLINLETARGVAYLAINSDSIVSSEPTGSAIVGFDSDNILTAPVVSEIHPGLGMSITPHIDPNGRPISGSFDIHNNSVLSSSIELNVSNLNGVIFGSTSSDIGYLFPAGITASLSGTVRVPYSAGRIGARFNILVNGRPTSLDIFNIRLTEYDQTNLTKSVKSASVDYSDMRSGTDISQLSADLGGVAGGSLLSVNLQSTQNTAVEVLSVSLELYNTQ